MKQKNKKSTTKGAKNSDLVATSIIANGQNQNQLSEMPVRPSSASLHQFDSLNKKNAEKVRERKTRGNIEGATIYQHQDLAVEVKGALQFDEITDKVHNWALIKYQRGEVGEDGKVYFNIAEYMKLTKLKDRKTARQQLAESIHNLVGIKLSRNNLDKLSKKQKDYEPFTRDTVLYIDGEMARGKGWLVFNKTFTKALDNTAQPMIISPKQFQLKGTAYYLWDALTYNKQVNYHNSPIRQNRMKFGTILKHCSNLPTWEDVKNSNRNYGDRIIKPLKKAIKELQGEISCSYIDSNGKTQNSIDNLPLEDFKNCYLVVTEWKNLNISQLDKLKKKR